MRQSRGEVLVREKDEDSELQPACFVWRLLSLDAWTIANFPIL